MKKSLNVLLVMIVALTIVLTGCGAKEESKGTDTEQPPAQETKTDTTDKTPATETTTDTEKKDDTATNAPAEIVKIKYATWGDAEMEKKRIKAFEAAHPNIKVEIDPAVTWPWDEKMAAAAAAGKLPDVVWLFGVPNSVASGWLEDLTPYLSSDPDYNPSNIYGNLSDTGKYNGKQFALPHGLFAQGIFLNLDLLAKENIPVPTRDWTVTDMEDIAKKLTKFNDHQFGFEGALGMEAVMVPQFDPSLGWGTWDGTKYNYTKPAYADAVNWVNKFALKDKIATDAYAKEEKDKWYGKDKSGWNLGKVGMRFGATWDLAWQKKELKFKWDILPLPKVNGQRTPLVTDYAGISKSSQHKKEAFEFLKWMTYSKDGWLNRIKDEAPIASMPLVNDRDVWDAYLSSEHISPGMKEIVKTIPDGFIDGYKWLPGYSDVLAKVVDPYNEKFRKGQARPEDVAAEFEQKANELYQNTIQKINDATK